MKVDSEVPSAPQDKDIAVGLGHETQTMNLYPGGLQMEGSPKHTWWKARVWSELLGDLCSYPGMASNPIPTHSIHYQVMVHSPD